MSDQSGTGDRCVVVVGAGAGGTLVATHLLTALSTRFRVELVDDAPTTGRGPAYSTTDERHLLNVPASGMSAFPRDPDHFLRWLRNHHDPDFQPQRFAPRGVYGTYIQSLLTTAAEFPGNASFVRRRARAVDIVSGRRRFRRRALRRPADRGPRRRARHRQHPGHELGTPGAPRRPAAGERPVDAADPRHR